MWPVLEVRHNVGGGGWRAELRVPGSFFYLRHANPLVVLLPVLFYDSFLICLIVAFSWVFFTPCAFVFPSSYMTYAILCQQHPSALYIGKRAQLLCKRWYQKRQYYIGSVRTSQDTLLLISDWLFKGRGGITKGNLKGK